MQRGARMERIGQVVSQIGLEIEDKVNDARAMEATNAFENGVNKAFLEYRQLQGKDGVDGLAAFQQQVQELRDNAGGMLMNDMQRAAAMPIFDKIGARTDLRAQEHYMAQAAADKQAQSIARRKLKSDTLSSMDLVIEAPMVGTTSTITTINPEAIVELGQFNNLLEKEADARGLTGDDRTLFMLTERDNLIVKIVNSKLDSEEQAQINQARLLIQNLPDDYISQTSEVQMIKKVIDRDDSALSMRDIVSAYDAGSSLEDVMDSADALLRAGVLTEKQHAKKRQDAENYYRQQSNARAEQKEELLDEVAGYVARGETVPSELETRAIEMRVKDSFDRIVASDDTWIGGGKELWSRYTVSPEAAVADYKRDPEGFTSKIDALMPWRDAQGILRSVRDTIEEQSGGGGGRSGGSKGQSGLSVTTLNQVASMELHSLTRQQSTEQGLVPYMDNDTLQLDQKTGIETRWKLALEGHIRRRMAADTTGTLDPKLVAREEASKLWESGKFPQPDGKIYNKWMLPDFMLPENARDIENEVDDDGVKFVDKALAQIQRDRADQQYMREVARGRAQSAPVSSALLGMPDSLSSTTQGGIINMRSDSEVRQQVLGTMQANMEMFGTPLPDSDDTTPISQGEIYMVAGQMIEAKKQRALDKRDAARGRREEVLIQRLNELEKTDGWKAALEQSKMGLGENLANMTLNMWDWAFSIGETVDRPTRPLFDLAPRLNLALDMASQMKLTEGGNQIDIKEEFLRDGSMSEDDFRRIVGHHSISNFALEQREDPIPQVSSQMAAGGRDATTYAERRDARNQLIKDRDAEFKRKYPVKALQTQRNGIAYAIRKIENNIEGAQLYDPDRLYEEKGMTYGEFIAEQQIQAENLKQKLPVLDEEIQVLTEVRNLRRQEELVDRRFKEIGKDPRDAIRASLDKINAPEWLRRQAIPPLSEGEEASRQHARMRYEEAKRKLEELRRTSSPEARKLRQQQIDEAGVRRARARQEELARERGGVSR